MCSMTFLKRVAQVSKFCFCFCLGSMTQGNIGAWNKKVGDSIAPGEVLVEIETDKAQMDFEFQEEGYIAKILTDENAKEVSVGQVCNNDTECKRVFIGVLVAHTFIFLAYCCFSWWCWRCRCIWELHCWGCWRCSQEGSGRWPCWRREEGRVLSYQGWCSQGRVQVWELWW